MSFIKQLENILFAIKYFTVIRRKRQLAATLVLAMGACSLSAALAGELDVQKARPATQQLALQTPLESLEQPSLTAEETVRIQAQTQYLAAKFRQSESAIRAFVELAWKEASRHNEMPPELLIAIMQKESSLRPKVESRYGAQGLMQVVRRWHHDKLHPSESLFDPAVNIRVGADVLEEYLEDADGNLRIALRKYSGNAQGYATRVLNESYKLARLAAEAAGQVVASAG